MDDDAATTLLYRLLHEAGTTGRMERLETPEAIEAVVAMAFRVARSDDIEARHALGWWHEVLAEGAATAPVRTFHREQAMDLLLAVYLVDPDQVPETMARPFSAVAVRASAAAAQQLINLNEGGSSTDLDLAVESSRVAVAHTPYADTDRPYRIYLLAASLRSRDRLSDGEADLDEAADLLQEEIPETDGDHPVRANLLTELAGILSLRSERTDSPSDLDKSVATWRAAAAAAVDLGTQVNALSRLGDTLRRRFDHSKLSADLDEAVAYGRQAVAVTPTDHPDRTQILSRYHASLQTRLLKDQSAADLEDSVAVGRAILASAPDDHPDRPRFQSNLSVTLLQRSRAYGSSPDLDSALALGRAAAAAAPADLPDRASILVNLGTVLQHQYRRTDELQDLDEMVAVSRDALASLPSDSSHLAGVLYDFTLAVATRFRRTAGSDDLEEAIGAGRSCLDATEDDHPHRADRLVLLADLLRSRHDASGSAPDLDEAVELFRAGAAAALHDSLRAEALSQLEGTLRVRFDRTGFRTDIEESVDAGKAAVAATPTADAHDHAGRLTGLSVALTRRFNRFGSLSDVDEALTAGRAAAAMTPTGDPERWRRLANLAVILEIHSGVKQSPKELDEAVEVGRNALRSLPANRAGQSQVLGALASVLQARFERYGLLTDLNEAVELARATLGGSEPDKPYQASHLNSLASLLLDQFEHGGVTAALHEAVTCSRAALAHCAETSPDRCGYLANLSAILVARYLRFGTGSDLAEAITTGREAVTTAPVDHPGRAGALSNLGNALLCRYESVGSSTDLDEAIVVHRAALATSPRDRAGPLSGLSRSLSARYARNRSPDDLDEIITCDRTALSLTSEHHTRRAGLASNLGVALMTRFELTQDESDLDGAIAAGQAAVAATPDGHPNRASRLANLSTEFLTRYEQKGLPTDLDQAEQVARRAVDATPIDDPNRAMWLFDLGMAIRSRYERTDDPGQRRAAMDAFRAAADVAAAPPLVVSAATASWAWLADGIEAAEAYGRTLALMPLVAARSLTFDDSVARMSRVSRVGRNAAAAFLDVDRAEEALSAVEHGRAVTFGRMLQTRTDLTDLVQDHPNLATRLAAAIDAIDGQASASRLGLHEASPDPTRSGDAQDQARLDLEAALKEVRALGGRWQRFFLPPLVKDLCAAAAEGPIVVVNVARRRCDALIVISGGVDHVPLPDLTEADAIEQANHFLAATSILSGRAYGHQRRVAELALHRVLSWLWEAVVERILGYLGHDAPRPDHNFHDWPRVWWIPTGPLAILPIQAAGRHRPPGQPGPPLADDTAMDRVVSSTVPTIAALAHARHRPSADIAAERILAVAMPRTPSRPGEAISDLPGTRAEVDGLVETLRGHHVTTLAEFGPEPKAPNKATVLQALPSHAWVHFACHARSEPLDPTRSSLLLQDHLSNPLTVLDLTSSHLPQAQLAYLSACTTARTGINNLDEPIHLAAAAIIAGYRHVIATLWPLLDDAEPARVIYHQLKFPNANSPNDTIDWSASAASVAVHHAAHQKRAKHNSTPFDWANLVHHGP